MANVDERTFGQKLNTWVQTVGIVIAALWGVYTFIYKEIMLPKSAPINITLNLQLKKIGTSGLKSKDQKEPLVAVEMRVSATNPSSRTVNLLPSAWIAYGFKITPAQYNSKNPFDQHVAASLKSRGHYVERHVSAESFAVVAVGSLFTDVFLKPGETTGRTVIFHAPPDKYDLVDVYTMMPTAAKTKEIDLEWTVNKETLSLEPIMYRVGAGGKRTPMDKDKDDGYTDARLDLQMAMSTARLSLWP